MENRRQGGHRPARTLPWSTLAETHADESFDKRQRLCKKYFWPKSRFESKFSSHHDPELMADVPLWQVSDKAESFVAEVQRWKRAWRYGRRELTFATAGFLLSGAAAALIAAADKKLPPWANSYILPATLALAAACFAWAFLRVLRQPVGPPAPPPSRPRVIRGPAAFGPGDAQLFARLGRQRELDRLREWARDDRVSLIAVCGESGVGKTSLLRAGLEGAADPRQLRVIYWEARPTDPERGLLLEIQRQWPADQRPPSKLPSVLAARPATRTVIVIDQAEQLSPERQAPIFDLFRKAAAADPPNLITWVIAFREDYLPTWRELELSLPAAAPCLPQTLLLKRLRRDTAIEAISVLVEEGGLAIDTSTIGALVDAVADEKGVSPVDIGIALLALDEMPAGRSSLSASTFIAAGGIYTLLSTYLDGLLERFLPAERKEIGRALLQLVDLHENRRVAEGRSANELVRGAHSARPDGLIAALDYLASARARILEVLAAADGKRYRLVHERLIPAVRRLAGVQLVELEQARLLLDRAFTTWTADRDATSLLSGRDLRRVRANLGEMRLGDARDEKLRFVTLSQRRDLWRMAQVSAVLITVLLVTWWGVARAQSQAVLEATLLSWSLPKDLASRAAQLDSLTLPRGVKDLAWLENVRSLRMLDVWQTELTDLHQVPPSVKKLRIQNWLPGLPPTVVELDISYPLFGRGFILPPSVKRLRAPIDFSELGELQLPATVKRVSLTVMRCDDARSLAKLPPQVDSISFQLGNPRGLSFLPASVKYLAIASWPSYSGSEVAQLPATIRSLVLSGAEPIPSSVATKVSVLKLVPARGTASRGLLSAVPPGVMALLCPDLVPEPEVARELAGLPDSVKILYFDHFGWANELLLKQLPPSVRTLGLALRADQIPALQKLPASVVSLRLAIEGKISSALLRSLPHTVSMLDLRRADIDELGSVPSALQDLLLRPGQVKTLDGMPESVRTLEFSLRARASSWIEWDPLISSLMYR